MNKPATRYCDAHGVAHPLLHIYGKRSYAFVQIVLQFMQNLIASERTSTDL